MTIRHGELKHMIVPLISIDEFSAKTGTNEEIVVVAFYLKEEMAAYDLDDFIDKGVTQILDSEVSPNPDLDGLWLVFVELRRRSNFWNKLSALVEDIENLTGEQQWKVQVYGEKQLYKLTDDRIKEMIPLDEDEYRSQRTKPELTEYFESSLLSNFALDGQSAIFETARDRLELTLVDFGLEHKVSHRQNLDEAQWNPMQTCTRCQALRHLLGADWNVQPLTEHIVVWRDGDERVALFQ